VTIVELHERLKHCQQQIEHYLRLGAYSKAKEWESEAAEVEQQIREAWSK
jgi:hypothetical protein